MYKRKSSLEFAKKDKEFEEYIKKYMTFLENVKTEREVVKYLVEKAEKVGFKDLEKIKKIKPGDKIYLNIKEKAAIFAKIGKKDILEESRLIAAHGDSPRLELKKLPVWEDKETNIGMFKLLYYGGIVHYQWVNIPLEIRGIVVDKKGKKRYVKMDETFIIPDLLPHLSKRKWEDNERKGRTAVKGEELRLIAATGEKEIKKKILELLKKKYGIEEEDIIFGELYVVPKEKPIEVGLDRSLIAAYGQDDRVNVFTGFNALLKAKSDKTIIFWSVDKEEIGSEGNSSAQTRYFEYFIGELLKKMGKYEENAINKVLINMKAISADVNLGAHPLFKEYYDLDNTGKIGNGIVISKYSNTVGKKYCNDTNSEFANWFRRVLDERGIPWQPGLVVSKVDEKLGGGGTISSFLSRMGMDVIDAGTPLLSMHSPLEISHKGDVFATYKAFLAFYEG